MNTITKKPGHDVAKAAAKLTPKARAFVIANANSPVISGSVIGAGGNGGYYTLKDGKRFKISNTDSKSMPYPVWLDMPEEDDGGAELRAFLRDADN